MRRIINSTYISLDGVIERLEDWHFQYHDDETVAVAMKDLAASDAVLMGRATYTAFAAAWSNRSDEFSDRMNNIQKYVASTTLENAAWNNTTILDGDLIAAVAQLKDEPGNDIISYGFGPVARTLLANGLLDEIHFWVHPVFVGRADPSDLLFRESAPAKFVLRDSQTLGSGVVILAYDSTSAQL